MKPAEDHDPLRPAVDAVYWLAGRDRLLDVIRRVQNDTQAVERYSRISLRHPLGHDKIVLLDSDSEFQLRIHAWWPEESIRMEHVHNHRFGFASTVLRGQYEMQIFRPSRTGAPMIEYRQHTSLDNTKWFLEAKQTTHLRLLNTTRVITGGGYALTAEALHRITVPPHEPCITLFLALIKQAGMPAETQVFAPPGSDAPSRSDHRPFTPETYMEKLDAVVAELR